MTAGAEPLDPVVIGVAVGPHGVRGTVRVKATGSGRHLREGVAPFVAGRKRRIEKARSTPKGFLVDLDGVADRPAAAALKGEEIFLDRGELDAPDDGEFYVGDLVGLAAVDEAGVVIGAVAETIPSPAHEVLVVRTEDSGPDESAEVYVPFTLEHAPEVDLRAGRVVVRPPRED